MHVISQKRIWEAKMMYPDAVSALDGWYRIIKVNDFNNYAELKCTFNSVDKINNKFVFNLGGNKYRLITTIHFNRQKVYVRDVLRHKEYDKGNW